MNEGGSDTLVGIVSKRLGESCSQQDYAVFTNVAVLLPWIESKIKENGGMASCSFNFSAPPTPGISTLICSHFCSSYRNILISNKDNKRQTSFRRIIGATPFAWSSVARRSINQRTTCFHRDLWLRELYNSSFARDPLRFWILHHPHPAATAGCMWRLVDGKTKFHRLPHTQCNVCSVGTRHI